MADLKEKNEAAKYMKISVRTLDKFLKRHKGFAEDGLVDMEVLEKWIEKECGLRPDK